MTQMPSFLKNSAAADFPFPGPVGIRGGIRDAAIPGEYGRRVPDAVLPRVSLSHSTGRGGLWSNGQTIGNSYSNNLGLSVPVFDLSKNAAEKQAKARSEDYINNLYTQFYDEFELKDEERTSFEKEVNTILA